MHCADLTVHMAKNLSGGNLRNTQSIVLNFFSFLLYYVFISEQFIFFFVFAEHIVAKNKIKWDLQ